MARTFAIFVVVSALLLPSGSGLAVTPKLSFQQLKVLAKSTAHSDRETLKDVLLNSKVSVSVKCMAIRLLGPTLKKAWVPVLSQLTQSSIKKLAAQAIKTLYQWKAPGFGVQQLKTAQDKGVPVRDALRLGFNKGQWLYNADAKTVFNYGLNSRHVRVQIDSAIGFVELGHNTAASRSALERALTHAPRFDDRLMVVNLLKTLPHWSHTQPLLMLATQDSDTRVSAKAKRILKNAHKAVRP